jgi:hypothetical protein
MYDITTNKDLTNKNMYLSIGGFIIRVTFIQHSDPKIEGINNLQKQVIRFFRFFIMKSQKKRVSYSINLIPQNVSYEQLNKRDTFMYFFKEKESSLTSFTHISIGQFIFLVLYALQRLLIKHEGFIYHGSAIEKEGKAIIFTGRPGAGKSTAATLLSNNYQILADDSIIIRKHNNQFFLYQMPLIEKNISIERSPKKYLINTLLFLKKNPVGSIKILQNTPNIFLRFFQEVWSQQHDIGKQKKVCVEFYNSLMKKRSISLLCFPKKRKTLHNLIIQQAQRGPKQ